MMSRTGSNAGIGERCQVRGVREFPLSPSTYHLSPITGLTLVEILISVALLASAAVLVMQALAKGAYVSALAHDRLDAYTFASAKLADLDVAMAQGLVPDPAGQFRVGRQLYRWHLDTAPVAEHPWLEQMTLTVDWQQGRHARESHVTAIRRLAELPQKDEG